MFGFRKKGHLKGRKLVVDIGTQYVKVVDLQLKKGLAKLNAFRILNLVTGGRRFINKEISKIIKKSVLDIGFPGRD